MRRTLQWFDSAAKIVAGLTGLVALLTGAVGLYFILRPPPPKMEAASFAANKLQQFGPPTSLSSYIKLAGETELQAKYSGQELRTAGVYYTVPVTLIGLRGTTTSLRWSLFRAVDKAPVEDWINQDAGNLRPPRDHYSYLVRVWIQLPQTPGRYIAVIEVRRGNEALDSVSTPPFLGLIGAPAPPATHTTTTPAPPPTSTTRASTTTIGGTTTPGAPATTAATTQAPPPATAVSTAALTVTTPPRMLVRPPAMITTTTARP